MVALVDAMASLARLAGIGLAIEVLNCGKVPLVGSPDLPDLPFLYATRLRRTGDILTRANGHGFRLTINACEREMGQS
jgi:hypothetical protein